MTDLTKLRQEEWTSRFLLLMAGTECWSAAEANEYIEMLQTAKQCLDIKIDSARSLRDYPEDSALTTTSEMLNALKGET